MAKILLDYFMPVSTVESTPEASTAFLKQVIVVAKPATGQEGNVGTLYSCATMTAVAVRTDNEDSQALFDAGMTKVLVLLADDLDLADYLEENEGEAYTLLISSDFVDADLTTVPVAAVAASRKIQDITYTAKTAGTAGNSIAIIYANTNSGGAASASASGSVITVSIETAVTTAATIATAVGADTASNALVSTAVDVGDETDPQVTQSSLSLQNGAAATVQAGDVDVGGFEGVVGYSSSDAEVCALFAATEKHCGFFKDDDNDSVSMFYAFGKLLSNLATWLNQQFITMPVDDGVATLGDANSLFDDRVSFVISDDEFGTRLAMFCAGGKAIVAPYIKKNLSIDIQSRALSWIAANQPQYTLVNASLLEQRLQEDVLNKLYIQTQLITAGVISITLLESNFVANGDIDIADPTALWRIFSQMATTL